MGLTHTVKHGDTIFGIAKSSGLTLDQIKEWNPQIKNLDVISPGQVINLSAPSQTGEKEWNGYTSFEYPDYQESDAVKDVKNKKNEAEEALANYGDFSYKNQAGLEEIMQKILNREDFSYDFNSDALYQQYKDKYIKQGKMAMQDTIGQASAMTGGYGNSYAATAGNQAYQASLENLNDIIPELYQMAYDRYNQEGQDMLNQYGLLSDDYNREYGAWEAGYNRLADDRSYYGTQFDSERSWDYGKWADDRDFKQSEHQTEQGYLYQDSRDKIEDERYEEQWDFQMQQYEDGETSGNLNNSGGGGKVVGDEDGKVVGDEIASIPIDIKNKAGSFESNTALASYLDGLEASGAITTPQSDYLYAQYSDANEKYDTKSDGSSSASYESMVGSTQGWEVVDDGGFNYFWGIDNDVIVKAPNGERVRLDDLVEKLVSEGMDKKAAKAAVKKLQNNLGE